MDEVFGNSSAETVVSVQDLDTKCDEKKTKDTCTGDESVEQRNIGENVSAEPLQLSRKNSPESNNEFFEREKPSNYDPVTKCLNPEMTKQEPGESVFKVPIAPSAFLRHVHSKTSARPSTTYSRTRAHTTNAVLQQIPTPLKHHPYQNIPLNSPSLLHAASFPCYVNVPERKGRKTCIKGGGSPSSPLSKTYSAPSTPKGSRNTISPRVGHSYIQLWTGVKQEEHLSSDQDCSERISQTGYVSMSSPYIRSPNSSILSELAGQLSSHPGSDISKDIFCPFCPRPFTQEVNLKHHIQAIHRHELQLIARDKDRVEVQICPLCRTRFFNLTLLPSHLLEFHRENLVDIMDKHENIKLEGNELKCMFCPKKVPASKLGEDILLYHLLQLHSAQYENFIRSLFQPIQFSLSKNSLTGLSTEDLAHALSFKPGLTSTPGLSLKFKELNCESESTVGFGSHLNLEETWSSHCAERREKAGVDCSNRLASQTINKGILRSQTDLSRKPSNVKRELRFSVPPVTSEEFFIPESPESQDSKKFPTTNEELREQDENECPTTRQQNIPVRIDSLSSADFIEMTHMPLRKRRRIGLGLKSKKSFKKRKSETSHLVENVFDGLKSIGCGKPLSANQNVVTTSATRTFRKPKPVLPPTLPSQALAFSGASEVSAGIIRTRSKSVPPPPSLVQAGLPHPASGLGIVDPDHVTYQREHSPRGTSPFGCMKLYSPVRMFRCNSCRVKFCDNESLGSHIRGRHRGLLGFLRPQFGCGVCSAKFYENKYLVKHCLQHHTSLLEIRSPKKHKITIYRFSKD